LIYSALLSATAKAFLLQAETEVTAKPDTALPLAKVLVSLLITLPDFSQALYARLIQRVGFWAVPFPAPIPVNATKEEKDAIHGVRREDTDSEKRLVRIGGIMTLLFCVMHTPHPQPLPDYFRLGRFWTYISRLLSSKELCASNVSLEILRGTVIPTCNSRFYLSRFSGFIGRW
jgi:nucleoporin GLE1